MDFKRPPQKTTVIGRSIMSFINNRTERRLEIASGLGILLLSITLLRTHELVENYLPQFTSSIFVYWFSIVGMGQLINSDFTSRLIFNLMATSVWALVATRSFIEADGFNYLSAASVPYCLVSMYIFGELLGRERVNE